jgi:hypothetical protein
MESLGRGLRSALPCASEVWEVERGEGERRAGGTGEGVHLLLVLPCSVLHHEYPPVCTVQCR